MIGFGYHPDILERFPEICGGVILAEGMRSGPSPQGLQEAFLAEQRMALARIGDSPLSELEALAAWRAALPAVH